MSSLPKVLAALLPLALAPAVAAAQPVLPGSGTPSPAPGGTAPTAPGLITKLTANQLQQLYQGVSIRGQQLQTSVKTFDDGSAVVYLPLFGSQVTSGAVLESCAKDGSGCQYLEFFVNLGQQPTIDANWREAFNETAFGAKAYLANDKGLVISYGFYLETGVTKDYILASTADFLDIVKFATQFKPQ